MSKSFATGTQAGTGAVIDIELGFKPDYVIVQNHEAADIPALRWFKGMANASAIKTVTSTNSKIATNGITILNGDNDRPEGFRIGADTDVNVAGEDLTWVAFRDID